MDNSFLGHVYILFVATLYIIAYINYRNVKFGKCLGLIVLAGLLLRIYTACDFYLHDWDEQFHALVAKNLIDNPWKPMLYVEPLLDYDFKNWAANHTWVHKQPFPLYSMALSMWIFGENVIALRLPSIILSTFAIFSTYKIGELLWSKKIGLIAAFFFSTNGLIIEQTAGRVATDHIDVFFFSLISIAVWLLLKSKHERGILYFILGIMATGLAVLSKWLPALIVFPIWFIYTYKGISTKDLFFRCAIFLIGILAIVLPWQLYIHYQFPLESQWESLYNRKHIFEVLDLHGKPFYYHFEQMRMIFGELVYLPFVWLIHHTYKSKWDSRKLILLIWIWIPYLFFSFAKTKMQGYVLFCAPAIFYMIALFIDYLQNLDFKFSYLTKLIIILLIALPIRYSIERIKPLSKTPRSQVWISDMKALESRSPSTKQVIFNCKYPIKTMFHTNMVAYETLPSLEKLEAIHRQGYTIYIDRAQPMVGNVIPFAKYVSITDF